MKKLLLFLAFAAAAFGVNTPTAPVEYNPNTGAVNSYPLYFPSNGLYVGGTAIAAGGIPAPVSPSTGNLLYWDGSAWSAATLGTGLSFTSSTLNAATLATVNGSPGTFGGATQSLTATVNGTGLITALSAQAITPPWSSITGHPTTAAGYGITNGANIDSVGTGAIPGAFTATTQTYGDNSTHVATDAFVQGAISVPTTGMGTVEQQRMVMLGDGNFHTVAYVPTGAGMLNKVWLATYNNSFATDSRLTLIRITFNGAPTPQIGGTAGIPLGDLFGPGFEIDGNLFMTDSRGVSYNSNSALSGYIKIPMPFSNGFKIEVEAPIDSGFSTRSRIQNGQFIVFTAGENFAAEPSSSLNSFTGSFEVDCEINLANYANGSTQTIVNKWASSSPGQSWGFEINGTGYPVIYWYDGSTTHAATSTAIVPVSGGTTVYLRGTMSANNGAGGNTVTFFTSSDGSSWTQLGSPVVNSGTTSVQAGTSFVSVGAGEAGTQNWCQGTIYYVNVLSGIGGPQAVTFAPSSLMDGVTSWEDSLGAWWATNCSGQQLFLDADYATSNFTIGQLVPGAGWTLHADEVESATLAPGAQHTFLATSVPTLLAGVYHFISPASGGSDYHFLEGDYRISDTGGAQVYESSGTEDFYGASYYFQSGLFATDDEGMTDKGGGANNGDIAAYRFLNVATDMPYCPTGLTLTWMNGDVNNPGSMPSYNVDSKAVVMYYLQN